jgi:hypothetical protein
MISDPSDAAFLLNRFERSPEAVAAKVSVVWVRKVSPRWVGSKPGEAREEAQSLGSATTEPDEAVLHQNQAYGKSENLPLRNANEPTSEIVR